MKSLFSIFSVLLMSSVIFAAENIPLSSQLRGTAWEGSYKAVGLKNQIRIVFLNELTANGDVQYFHDLGKGLGNLLIGPDDAGCALTPRSLHVNSETDSGHIAVYTCEDNLETELGLESNQDRNAKQTIEVQQVAASESELSILVSIEGIGVKYSLYRVTIDPAALRSRNLIHRWLGQH